MMRVLSQKRIHAVLALTLVTFAGLMMIYLSIALIGSANAQMNAIAEKKERIAALENRHEKANKSLAQYRNQLGILAATNEESATLIEEDLETLRRVFSGQGVTLSEGAATIAPPYTKIELSAYGDGAELLEAFSEVGRLHSKLSVFSIQAVDPRTPDTPSMISFTLTHHSGNEEAADA